MAFRNTNSAESWDKIYEAFAQVNFTSFDFDTIKQSLIDYLRLYYPEVFNDLIESSELIALLEMFAYVAEQLAYRVDMVSHENFITTAQRKQSILRLAKLISYKATRNIPVRGLVKFTSVSTTERVIDARGTDLSGLVIGWNDPNNSNWKEQFLLVMNRVLSTRFGQPQKTYQVGDVVMDLYSLNANTNSFSNGVFPYTASTGLDSYPMEVVPADLDDNGPYEREPDLNAAMSIVYANDGIGDGSDYTGFLAYTKQGTLARIDYNILEQLPNRRLEFLPDNVNHTDVWVQKLNTDGTIAERWKQVETVNEQNLIFNNDRTTRKKYETDTLENDQIAVVFGDGDFTDAPVGLFRFWMRQSVNRAIVIAKTKVVNETLQFTYTSSTGNTETCTLTFSLTSTLQNGAGSETIEHVRQSAPATYYAQNRMVNGQDYNTYLLKDPTILRLNTVNRTFAGQPKYIDWNDASGSYENVKVFGDDLVMRYELGLNSLTTSLSGQALIDSIIEPLLQTSGVVSAMVHLSATNPVTEGVVSSPRRSFVEDNRANLFYSTGSIPVQLITGVSADGSLKEKTAMQALIDRHWYGEPLEYVEGTGSQIWARIPDPALFPKDDSRIYAASVPRTIDGVTKFPPGDIGSGLQPIAEQDYFALRYNRTMVGVGQGLMTPLNAPQQSSTFTGRETWTIEIGADGETYTVRSNLRGTFPSGAVGPFGSPEQYDITPSGYNTPVQFFEIQQASGIQKPFEPGDAFILDIDYVLGVPSGLPASWIRNTGSEFNAENVINLNGWWELIGYSELPHFSGGQVVDGDELLFTQDAGGAYPKQYSWLIFIRKIRQQPTNNVIGYEIHYRDVSLVIESPTTKFWFNEVDQLLDSETKKKVYDNIKVLRSNLDSNGDVLGQSQLYDVVGPVKDGDGVVDFHKLQVVPSDLLQEDDSGNLEPDCLLQFETFSADSFEYFTLAVPDTILTGPTEAAAITAFTHIASVSITNPGAGYNSSNGGVLTLGAITPGAAYTDGTYLAEPLTGGTGAGATADITVLGGVVTAIALVSGGDGYSVADILSAALPLGAGFSVPVTDVQKVFTAVPFINGAGSSADITVANGAVTQVVMVDTGTGFETGMTLTVDNADLGGSGSGFLITVTAATESDAFVDPSLTYGRRQRMPSTASSDADPGLDFMWQHFAPYTNIIDPSVTNIHDAYVLTQGYYDSVVSYVRGLSTTAPSAPTPLDLRNSYGYLLENKMLSDTVVLHPGKLRLLFGTLAEPQLRGKFKVVRAPGATLTNERVKEELLDVINTYFDVSNWDFGETFYVTELIALMHQRLPTEIASVVLVPLYSTNSFGDLFTVECGFDEILQSAAQLTDIEVVEALTPTTIRQVR